jgi:hypothetical protein
MRSKGETNGHELKTGYMSKTVAGSQVGTNDTIHAKKNATILSTDDLATGNYDSGDDIAGREPDVHTYGKVEHFKH